MRHNILQVNEDKKTGICAVCGDARLYPRRDKVDRYRCATAANRGVNPPPRGSKGYKHHKKNHCESPDCMWYGPYDKALLDVDHIDGNKKNNAVDNLQTLCSNCHRLKTMRQGDWKRISER